MIIKITTNDGQDIFTITLADDEAFANLKFANDLTGFIHEYKKKHDKK